MTIQRWWADENYLFYIKGASGKRAEVVYAADYDALAAELAIYKGREEAKQLVISQLEGRVAALEVALNRYGRHLRNPCTASPDSKCVCGLAEALRSVPETEVE